MRRPLTAELSAEERSVARRWLVTGGSLYTMIVALVFGVLMLTSGADKAEMAATSERQALSQDRLPTRPYCNAAACVSLNAGAAGRDN